MKKYELTYLVSPELSEEGLKSLQEKINSLIQKDEGILGEISINSQIKLSYPIKKKTSAYLITLNFQLDPKKIVDIEKTIKTETDVLRYIILIKPPVRRVETRQRRIPSFKPLEKISRPKPKVELKEIEKKLEEILE